MAATPNGPKQKNRHLSLETPLGTDVLVLRGLDGHEKLSTPFRLELDAVSTDPAIAHKDILGQSVTVKMDLPDHKKRYFNGFVSRFELHGYDGQFAHYRALVVPWLWFLTRTTDCRIFQDKSIPDIVQGIFREHGFTDFDDALTGNYEKFEYVTQYRETDFDFVSRLMEQEGIYYFFQHEEHKHTLVLADSYDAHQACPDYDKIPFYPPDSDKAATAVKDDEDYVWDWQTRQAVRPGTFALNDYDFTAPKKKLRTAANITRDHDHADYEMYDYPGGYTDKNVGTQYSQIRIEDRQSDFDTCQGRGNVRGLLAGGLTSLIKHPGEAHNREYLLTAVAHHVESDPMETGRDENKDLFYRCEFDLIDAKTQFRPPCTTPKGIIRGPQTAVVVGKSGETVWTDKYGRVKVQFHWDREGQNDEKSSCWVRVSQLWAGKNWGGMHIPHIDQEVIVDFLEGDPDRPIITGRVYNANNMPPLDLPDHKYFSIIRDDYGNEMKMESTPGDERMILHSPSHDSTIKFDKKSVQGYTKSNKTDYVYGNTDALRIGNVTSGTLGSKAYYTMGHSFTGMLGISEAVKIGMDVSAFAGAKAAFSVGPQINIGLDTKFAVGKSAEFTWAGGSIRQASAGDVVHESRQDVVLAGGSGGPPNGIVTASPTGASMSFGPPTPISGCSSTPLYAGAIGSGAAGLAAAVLALGVTQGTYASMQGGTREDVDAAMVGGAVAAGLVGLAGSLAGSLLAMKAAESLPTPQHELPTAKVSVANNAASISAGPASGAALMELSPTHGVAISAGSGKPVAMVLSPRRGVTVSSSATIKLQSKAGATINGATIKIG